MSKKLTIKEFIQKARQIHGSRYDYSKVNYINNHTKIIIICKKHGEFLQTPNNHLSRNNCPKCKYNNARLTKQEFINKANKVHNNKYNYSKTKIINFITSIIIICKKHGEFLQTPGKHLHGRGCFVCGKLEKIITQKFVNKAKNVHGNKYDYSKVNYINSKTKIIIICKKHGEFLQTPSSHLSGQNCRSCDNDRKKISKQEFVRKAKQIHSNKYDYSKVNYINSRTKIIIICPKHKEFKQIANAHLNGQACPRCSCRVSKGEKKWLNQIEKKDNIKIKRNPVVYINNKRFFPDGFHKKSNTWYEYYGNYFHGNPKIYNLNDINSTTKTTFQKLHQETLKREKIIKSAGYNLVTKWED